MNREVWQQLLSLESRDIVVKWFEKIHGRELNARRAKEIGASARQAREYFRGSAAANNSIRPLLTFYGVASLGRSLTLLLRREGGEEGLTRGHGLETVDWAAQLSGDLSAGLSAVGGIKIRTCAGLLADIARETKNRLPMHVRSGAVDWRLNYELPKLGDEVTLDDLLLRLPDLRKDHALLAAEAMYASINEMTYSAEAGFNAKVHTKSFALFEPAYEGMGYKIETAGDWSVISGSAETFSKNVPRFMHTYVEKMFGAIPNVYLVAPMPSGNRYSQLCMTYLVGYVLGMLARYYPTHWVSLAQGEKGDALWPTINRAQRFVEELFPEQAIELIQDVLAFPDKREG